MKIRSKKVTITQLKRISELIETVPKEIARKIWATNFSHRNSTNKLSFKEAQELISILEQHPI